MSNKPKLIIAVIAVLGIVGCGNNTGSSKSPVVPVPSPSPSPQPVASSQGSQKPSRLSARNDEEIEAFVHNHKQENITVLDLEIDWAKCSTKGFSCLIEFDKLERLILCDWQQDFTEKDGRFYFKPMATPDSFVEQITKIKSLRVIEVWYGCFPDNQKKTIKEKLPNCEVHEHMNKI